MIEIPLSAIPNQSFSIQLDDSIYDIKIKFLINFMAIDLSRNNEVILKGIRLVPGFPVIPFKYLEQGNFILITANGEYPNYNQFGINQSLFYASQNELEAFRASAN